MSGQFSFSKYSPVRAISEENKNIGGKVPVRQLAMSVPAYRVAPMNRIARVPMNRIARVDRRVAITPFSYMKPRRSSTTYSRTSSMMFGTSSCGCGK